jgi:hypothetical protein
VPQGGDSPGVLKGTPYSERIAVFNPGQYADRVKVPTLLIDAEKELALALVELLVVISIITLLTGILIPCIGKAKSIAKRTICRSHLHSAAIVFRMYLDNNNHSTK